MKQKAYRKQRKQYYLLCSYTAVFKQKIKSRRHSRRKDQPEEVPEIKISNIDYTEDIILKIEMEKNRKNIFLKDMI